MKKFITLFAVVAAVLALTTIGVSAVAGYVDDFSEPPVDGKIENYPNWKAYSATVKDGVTWEDGMIRFERLASNSLIWNISTNLNNPVNFTMFDAKFNEVGATVGIGGYYVNGAARTTPEGLRGFEPNVWYKIMFVSTRNEDGSYQLSCFAKPEGSDTWVRMLSKKMDTSSETPHLRFNWSNSKDADVGAVMYMDNFEAHEGIYWENLSLTDDFGTEIVAGDVIAEDASALTITAELYNAKNLSQDMMTNPQVMESTPIIVVYDASGMMLDCGIAEYDIEYFENTFSVTTELSDYAKSDIASIKLYLWDSIDGMLNVMEPVEFR